MKTDQQKPNVPQQDSSYINNFSVSSNSVNGAGSLYKNNQSIENLKLAKRMQLLNRMNNSSTNSNNNTFTNSEIQKKLSTNVCGQSNGELLDNNKFTSTS